MGAPVLYLL